MNVSIILAHPDTSSFNHAISNVVTTTLKNKGHNIFYHDLYQEKFDPIFTKEELSNDFDISPISNYIDEILNSDSLIIIHPNWWGQAPAILKGYLDRIFRARLIYKFDQSGTPIGLLNLKSGIVFNTSNTPEEIEINKYNDPLENFWKTCVFDFLGVTNFHRTMYKQVNISTFDQRVQWLQDVENIINNNF